MCNDYKPLALVLAVAFTICPLAYADPPAPPRREQIGEVLGKPFYRAELRSKYFPFPTGPETRDILDEVALHELFIDPVLEKYVADHRAEIEPTQTELAAVEALLEKRSQRSEAATNAQIRRSLQQVNEELSKNRSEFPRAYLEKCKRNAEGMLRGEIPVPMSDDSKTSLAADCADPLTEIDVRLAQLQNLSLIERVSPMYEKWSRKKDSAHPYRLTATFLYRNWKLQRHFYDRFGGGRVLWQQDGYEAFDAYRRWLESEERKGNFKISDAKLRQALYHYWKSPHTPFLTGDPERIRREFLQPEWAPLPAQR